MKKINKKVFVYAFISVVILSSFAGRVLDVRRAKLAKDSLSSRQQNIITIAAFTANGNLKKLSIALNKGLDAGLNINEIKEILIQTYAYAGFPRSLNALKVFEDVLNERSSSGINDTLGLEPSPMPANLNKNEYGEHIRTTLLGRTADHSTKYETFAPVIDQFLKEHLFADIFWRDNFDYLDREIAAISAISAINDPGTQLRTHIAMAINMGLTSKQIEGIAAILKKQAGDRAADNLQESLKQFLQKSTLK